MIFAFSQILLSIILCLLFSCQGFDKKTETSGEQSLNKQSVKDQSANVVDFKIVSEKVPKLCIIDFSEATDLAWVAHRFFHKLIKQYEAQNILKTPILISTTNNPRGTVEYYSKNILFSGSYGARKKVSKEIKSHNASQNGFAPNHDDKFEEMFERDARDCKIIHLNYDKRSSVKTKRIEKLMKKFVDNTGIIIAMNGARDKEEPGKNEIDRSENCGQKNRVVQKVEKIILVGAQKKNNNCVALESIEVNSRYETNQNLYASLSFTAALYVEVINKNLHSFDLLDEIRNRILDLNKASKNASVASKLSKNGFDKISDYKLPSLEEFTPQLTEEPL